MSVSFYADEHIPDAICIGLANRGVDILRAVDDGMSGSHDEDILDRATNLGRIVVTHDDDYLAIGARKQMNNEMFAGIAYCHQYRLSIGQHISELVLLSATHDPDDTRSEIIYLPLRK